MSDSRSPNEEYVMVRRRPGRRLRRTAILLLFSVACAAGGYFLGLSQTGTQLTSVVDTRDHLLDQLESLQQERLASEQRLINLERGRSIDEAALSQARHTIARLESRVAELEADLTFYRNIMAPSEVAEGLQVDRLNLHTTRQDGRYGFKLVLTQVGDNSSYIGGIVAVNVIGLRDGEKEVIALRDLSEEITDLGVKFRFRYFQDVEGFLTVPDSFQPLEVQVVAQAQGSKSSQAERTFDWGQLTEK